MSDDPRIFKPEVEQQQHIDAVIRGFIRPDGTRTDMPPGRSGSGGGGFSFTTLLLPFIMLFVAAVMWIGGFAGFAPRYRAILTALTPEAWVATSPAEEGNPLAVGIALGVLVLLVLIGLSLVRRAVARAWLEVSGVTAFLAGLAVFLLSAVTALVLTLTPGLVLIGTSIATGADLGSTPLPDDATVRAWPLVLTALAITWFALGGTRRTARRRRATRAAYPAQFAPQEPVPPGHGYYYDGPGGGTY